MGRPGSFDQLSVGIDPNDCVAPPGKLTADPALPATGVKDAGISGSQRVNTACFPMQICALRVQLLKTSDIGR
jgi:hypothetical protein